LAKEPQQKLAPTLMNTLPRIFDSVTREMSHTLYRSARSLIIIAKDFSAGIVTADGRLFMIDEGLPVHVGGMEIQVRELNRYFDDLAPGDMILNNSAFYGNTHHADYTLCAPVFYKDELLFWSLLRAHQADCGGTTNGVADTYLPLARDIYEESVHFPCVRVQRNYREIEDIIRIAKVRIRVPEQWYGDHIAQAGAVRTGEKRIIELCERYGVETIKEFVESWFAYGERLIRDEIRRMPRKTIKAASRGDPLPGVAPSGVPLKVTIKIDPDQEKIVIDLRDNIKTLRCGLNLSEATTLAAAYGSVFNNVSKDVPHNHGSLRRIEVLMAEDRVVGIPKLPTSTAAATTLLSDRLFNLISSAFAQLGKPYGLAEGNASSDPLGAVISGWDPRRKQSYVNQLCTGCSGGPATHGHDGWLTYGVPGQAGVIRLIAIELAEQRFPLLYKWHELEPDTGGAGEWEGAPALRVTYSPRFEEMSAAYLTDCAVFPPMGVLGGMPGARAVASLEDNGAQVEIPLIGGVVVMPNQELTGQDAGGGGYGDPLRRDPELVRKRVREGLLSVKKAKSAYKVVLDTRTESFEVDARATATSRRESRAKRPGARRRSKT
jgi:N-methylhydantoinase B